MKPFLPWIFLFGQAVVYASLSVLNKKAYEHVSPFLVISISMGTLALGAFVFALIFERGEFGNLGNNLPSVGLLVISGALNILGFWLLVMAFGHFEIWKISLAGLLIPIFASIYAFFLLGEVVSWKFFVGFAIMAIGLLVSLS